MKIAVIIPTYNEKENLPKLIKQISEVFKENNFSGYVLVSDANSPDGTGELADSLIPKYKGNFTLRVTHEKEKKGLGRAYVEAFKLCIKDKADLIIQMDADFSHNPKRIKNMVEEIQNGADLVIGSRYVNGGGVVDWGIGRKILSRGGSLYSRLILGIPLHDFTGGFNCYRREVLENINPDTLKANGYSFLIELKYKTYQEGYKVVETPIIFKDRTAGESKMSKNIFLEAMRNVWLLRMNKL